VWTREVK
jgi:hypothetical protein